MRRVHCELTFLNQPRMTPEERSFCARVKDGRELVRFIDIEK